jgi:hypothetical protein
MLSKPKENSLVTAVYDDTARTITFTSLGAGTTVLYLNKVSAAIKAQAMLHGFGQRVPDAAALTTDPPPKDATPEQRAAIAKKRAQEKLAGMVRLVDWYNTGTEEWSPARGPVAPKPLDPILVKAVMTVANLSEERVIAMCENRAGELGCTKHEYLAKLTENKAVAAEVDRLRAANVTADVDPDAELGLAREGS